MLSMICLYEATQKMTAEGTIAAHVCSMPVVTEADTSAQQLSGCSRDLALGTLYWAATPKFGSKIDDHLQPCLLVAVTRQTLVSQKF